MTLECVGAGQPLPTWLPRSACLSSAAPLHSSSCIWKNGCCTHTNAACHEGNSTGHDFSLQQRFRKAGLSVESSCRDQMRLMSTCHLPSSNPGRMLPWTKVDRAVTSSENHKHGIRSDASNRQSSHRHAEGHVLEDHHADN